jgi:hypothetical protein
VVVLSTSGHSRRLRWTAAALASFGVAEFLTAAATEANTSTSTRPCAWQAVRTADPHPILYDRFNSIVVVSPREAWAVGDYFTGREGGPHGAFVEHWNGRRWTLAHASIPPGASLESVSASRAGDLWAVGMRRNLGQLIEHWDGERWRVMRPPRPGGILHAVVARTPQDAWAVGTGKRGPGFGTLTEHWDGKKWTIVASPSPPARLHRSYAILQAVTAISATDVWAAGNLIVGVPANASRTLIEHWNGRRWTIVPSPNATSNGMTNDFLFSVSGSRGDDVWAVGSWGDYLPGGFGGKGDHVLALHWDGRRWSLTATPGLRQRSLLAGVAAVAGRAWAVGDRGLQPDQHALIERFDGKRWSVVPSPAGFSLSAVSTRPRGGAWAVGANGRRPYAARC